MSVELLDHRIFFALAVKMDFSAKHTARDIDHFSACNDFTQADIRRTVNYWHRLNYEGYALENDEPMTVTLPVIPFAQLPVSTFQFLKWLKCLRYNIDVERIEVKRCLNLQESSALSLLDRLIISAMESIIDGLPGYHAAKWCDY